MNREIVLAYPKESVMTTIKAYIHILKLRIDILIAFSAIAGYIITVSRDEFNFIKLFLLTILTIMASAGASAFNHYFDRDIDSVMSRTRNRPIPVGNISSSKVLMIASILILVSVILSSYTLNLLVALHLFLGAFVYVVIYTVWLKRRSKLNIIIGGLAGSFAVLAGGASAKPEMCLPPILLAIILFFWTPSHFWSFALFHKEDYKNAGVPMLPVVAGDRKTALYILLNTFFLFISSLLPAFFGYSKIFYILAAVAAGIFFIARNIQLFLDSSRDTAWKNFKASMIYLFVILLAVILDTSIR
ncbi:MAG: protoheme IX farnesyltransferase [Nitrospinae bacterium]|nr:protoheme IX farnesyltransferase [Nitrospinota bacterium]